MGGSPAAPDTASWRTLLGVDGRRPGEEAILRALLERLRRAHGWMVAGLYLEAPEGDTRCLRVGEGGLPSTPARAIEGDLRTLPLPGATLVYCPGGGPGEPDEDGLLALAAAVRAWRLRRDLERERFAVNYGGVGVEALYDVGLAIASTLDFDQLCDEILLRAVSLLDARRGALYLLEGECYRLIQSLGGLARPRVERAAPEIAALLAGRREVGDLLPGASHLLAAPIEVEGDARGLLLVADKESRRGVGPFPASDGRTLGLFANQAAIALENARLHREALEKERLERDIQIAADIQRRLLPTSYPAIEGFELAGWSRPARHVGGDYYNLLARPGGRLAVVVADVSGKGMPAALMVSTLHSALNLLLDRTEVGPDLVERLNRHILDASAPNKFITLLLAELDPPSGGVRYVNAGHNPALLVRAGGEVEMLPPGGLPLGIIRGSYRDGHADLRAGDLLCLYSDGITEAEAPDGEEFGPERLAELLRRGGSQPLSELVSAIDGATLEFARGAVQADDQTLVLLRRH